MGSGGGLSCPVDAVRPHSVSEYSTQSLRQFRQIRSSRGRVETNRTSNEMAHHHQTKCSADNCIAITQWKLNRNYSTLQARDGKNGIATSAVFQQSRHQFDQITRSSSVIQLVYQKLVPRRSTGAGRPGQTENIGAISDPGYGPGL